MDWIEQKYIGLVSVRLRNFKQRGNSYNFSCVLCGDSATNTRKARGYLYSKGVQLHFHCHNCGRDMLFRNFLKEVDPALYSQFTLETLTERKKGPAKFQDAPKPKIFRTDALSELKTVSQLPSTHKCRALVEKRMIPPSFFDRLYYAPAFMSWCNLVIPDKFKVGDYDEARLVIPFITNNAMHALQGRLIDDVEGKTRYIMLVNDETVPSVYGMDRVNLNKRVYCTEGPIDSMFLSNSLAGAGSEMHLKFATLPRDNLVLVYDNEPRSKETKNKMIKALRAGYSICVWPENIAEKDINLMILNGLSSDRIKYIIDSNIYSGVLSGEVAIRKWSKC